MSLVGPRPRSIDDLPPRPLAPQPQTGTCYDCGRDLKTFLDVALHGRCDTYLGMKHRRRGDRETRVRL